MKDEDVLYSEPTLCVTTVTFIFSDIFLLRLLRRLSGDPVCETTTSRQMIVVVLSVSRCVLVGVVDPDTGCGSGGPTAVRLVVGTFHVKEGSSRRVLFCLCDY